MKIMITKLIFSSLLLLSACASTTTLNSESRIPFSLDTNQHRIQGEIIEIKNADTIILFLEGGVDHGRTNNNVWSPLVDELKQKGSSIAIFDQRCFGLTNEQLEKLQTCTFHQIKQDALQVYYYLKSLNRYKSMIIIGHAEGSLIASEINFVNSNDQFIKKIILLGAFSQNYQEILHQQMTTTMSRDIFIEVDSNKDGKISQEEIPEHLKRSLPIEKLDTQKKGFFAQGDLLRLLEKQYQQFISFINQDDKNTILIGKPSLWYKELMAHPSLLGQASRFTKPVTIIHGKLDQVSPFNSNALTFSNKLRSLKKTVNLVAVPQVGHYFSEMKENLATKGPIQKEALKILVNAI